MKIELVANIISLVGCLMLVGIGLLKKKKHILLAQNAMFIVMSIAYLMLGGFGAVVSNAISLVRNTICLKWDLNLPLKIFFTVAQFIFTVLTNNLGFLGWLPFIAATIYTFFLDLKDEVKLKIVLIISQACWIAHDFGVHNYSGFVFDIITVCSTVIGICIILKDRKENI